MPTRRKQPEPVVEPEIPADLTEDDLAFVEENLELAGHPVHHPLPDTTVQHRTFDETFAEPLAALDEAIAHHNRLHAMHLLHHEHNEAGEIVGLREDGCCPNCRPLGDIIHPTTVALVKATQAINAARAAWPDGVPHA